MTANAIAVDHIQGVPLACLWIIDPVAGRVATHLFGAFRGAADEAHSRGVTLNITADAARLAFLKVESFSIASRPDELGATDLVP
ncbi:MAG TPA: hypothetical protein VF086_17230 [Propionibacteriaceae bacterium]